MRKSLPILALLLSLQISCQNSTNSEPQVEPVVSFTGKQQILDVTKAGSLNVAGVFPTGSGPLLVRDSVSSSIVLLATDGTPSIFVNEDMIRALTGKSSASLGPLDQISTGTFEGNIITADEVSGLLIRLDSKGKPSIHSTEAQIRAVTGEASARIHLPRTLVANQILAQDLVSGHLLTIGNNGSPRVPVLVLASTLSTAAGLSPGPAVVSQWVRGGTGNQFARFPGVNNVVRLRVTGQVDRYVDGNALEALFPDIAALEILKLVSDITTDGLLLLVGEGNQGIAVAVVYSNGDLEVFTSSSEFESQLGAGYNITDIGILSNGQPYAVDGGNAHVLLFESGGTPKILAGIDEIRDVAGTSSPSLVLSGPIFSAAIIVFEETLGNFLRFN